MIRAVQGARQVGSFARNLQRRSYQGAELSKRLGQTAGEFNRSRLGGFVQHKAPILGKISRGVESHAPQVERGLRRLGDIAGKVKDLERLELGTPVIPQAPAFNPQPVIKRG